MTRRVAVKFLDRFSLVALVWLALAITPLSWWGFTPGTIVVSDTTVGVPAKMGFTREITRPIQMRYTVTTRLVDGYQVACETRSGLFTYSPNATLPVEMDLAWWAPGDDRCANLKPPSAYIMETCWTAPNLLLGLLPDKTVCRESNVFNVVGPDNAYDLSRDLMRSILR